MQIKPSGRAVEPATRRAAERGRSLRRVAVCNPRPGRSPSPVAEFCAWGAAGLEARADQYRQGQP
jgi:hypothetical protein